MAIRESKYKVILPKSGRQAMCCTDCRSFAFITDPCTRCNVGVVTMVLWRSLIVVLSFDWIPFASWREHMRRVYRDVRSPKLWPNLGAVLAENLQVRKAIRGPINLLKTNKVSALLHYSTHGQIRSTSENKLYKHIITHPKTCAWANPGHWVT